MAVLALGALGAFAGSAIGGTFLGMSAVSIGCALGSYIGGALDLRMQKTKVPTAYGPRLNDLTIQASAYGNMIPIVFGRAKITGNLFWSTGRIEHTRTTTISQDGGGKGGGGGKVQQEQVEYYYTASFAIALCEGPILGVRKVWANGELIYDISADGVSPIGSAALPMTVYLGTEEQLADPVIESFEGAGQVPGYRGVAYVVVNDVELLQKWGQSIPNLEFEVLTAGTNVGLRAQPLYTLPEEGHLEFL